MSAIAIELGAFAPPSLRVQVCLGGAAAVLWLLVLPLELIFLLT